jgi:hypothetical protein
MLKRKSRRRTFCEEQNLTTSFAGPSDKKRDFSIDHRIKVRKCSMSIFSSENPNAKLRPRSPKSHRHSLLLCPGQHRKNSVFFPAPCQDKHNVYEPSDFESSDEDSVEYDFADETVQQEPARTTRDSAEASSGNHEIRKFFHHTVKLWFYMFLLITRLVRYICSAINGLVQRSIGWAKTQAENNLNSLVAFELKPETTQRSFLLFTSSDIRLARKGKRKSHRHKSIDKDTKPRSAKKITHFSTLSNSKSSPKVVVRHRAISCCPTVNEQTSSQCELTSHPKLSKNRLEPISPLGHRVRGQERHSKTIVQTEQRHAEVKLRTFPSGKYFEAEKLAEAKVAARNNARLPLHSHYRSRVYDF